MTPTTQIISLATKVVLSNVNYRKWSQFQAGNIDLLNSCRADVYISFSGTPNGCIEILILNDFQENAVLLLNALLEEEFAFSTKFGVKYFRPLGAINDKFNIYGTTAEKSS